MSASPVLRLVLAAAVALPALGAATSCRRTPRDPAVTYYNPDYEVAVRYPASLKTDQAEQDGIWYRYFLGPPTGAQRKPEVSVTLLSGPLAGPLEEYAQRGGRLLTVAFDESGWMLIRAVTDNAQTYRFASSGPFYVEIGNRPRISRKSAQFFLDWVVERARRIQLDDPQQREAVIKYHPGDYPS